MVLGSKVSLAYSSFYTNCLYGKNVYFGRLVLSGMSLNKGISSNLGIKKPAEISLLAFLYSNI